MSTQTIQINNLFNKAILNFLKKRSKETIPLKRKSFSKIKKRNPLNSYASYSKISKIHCVSISRASSSNIRSWAEKKLPNGKILGEVTSANTLHHKTFKPLKGGLFCERIFGPLNDFECACGIQKRPSQQDYQRIIEHKQINREFCTNCDVEYTWSIIRRYQMGYIKLAMPVTHLWYLKANPSYLSVLLNFKRKKLEKVIYCAETLTLENSQKIIQKYNTLTSPSDLFLSWQEILKIERSKISTNLKNFKKHETKSLLNYKNLNRTFFFSNFFNKKKKILKKSNLVVLTFGELKKNFVFLTEKKIENHQKNYLKQFKNYFKFKTKTKKLLFLKQFIQKVWHALYKSIYQLSKQNFMQNMNSAICPLTISIYLNKFKQKSSQLLENRFQETHINFEENIKKFLSLLANGLVKTRKKRSTKIEVDLWKILHFLKNIKTFQFFLKKKEFLNSFILNKPENKIFLKKNKNGFLVSKFSLKAISQFFFRKKTQNHQLNLTFLKKVMKSFLTTYLTFFLQKQKFNKILYLKESLVFFIFKHFDFLIKSEGFLNLQKIKQTYLYKTSFNKKFTTFNFVFSQLVQPLYQLIELIKQKLNFLIQHSENPNFFFESPTIQLNQIAKISTLHSIKLQKILQNIHYFLPLKMTLKTTLKFRNFNSQKKLLKFFYQKFYLCTVQFTLFLPSQLALFQTSFFRSLHSLPSLSVIAKNGQNKFESKSKNEIFLPHKIFEIKSANFVFNQKRLNDSYSRKTLVFSQLEKTVFFWKFKYPCILFAKSKDWLNLKKNFYNSVEFLKLKNLNFFQIFLANHFKWNKVHQFPFFYDKKKDYDFIYQKMQENSRKRFSIQNYRNWFNATSYLNYFEENKLKKNTDFIMFFSVKTHLNKQKELLQNIYFHEKSRNFIIFNFLKQNSNDFQNVIPNLSAHFFKEFLNYQYLKEYYSLSLPRSLCYRFLFHLKENFKRRKKVKKSFKKFNSISKLKNRGVKNSYRNNIYSLSYRELWSKDELWNYFCYYNFAPQDFEDFSIPKYKLKGLNYETNHVQKTIFTGAAIVQDLLFGLNKKRLEKIKRQNHKFFPDLEREIEFLRIFAKLGFATKTDVLDLGRLCKKKNQILQKTKFIRDFLQSKSRVTSMVLTLLPVLPPDLRPILKLQDQIAASDLNRLYQRVIYRNDRLKKFRKDISLINSFQIRYSQRLLQEAVDNLIQNGKGGVNPEQDSRGRSLKSLSEILKGKQGRFRQHLLGKRVDYSGRSVIVVGPKLKIHECGLPKEIAIELFLPFLIKKILHYKLAKTVIGAKTFIRQAISQSFSPSFPFPKGFPEGNGNVKESKDSLNQWKKAEFSNQDSLQSLQNDLRSERQKADSHLCLFLLSELMKNHPILLNRAPTLHRLGFQAFQPKLIEGRAILLHPLVCPPFNADFDGDQMAVHLPLTVEAQAEAWKLMFARNHLISPATGDPILMPSQDMVLGCYYLTTEILQISKRPLPLNFKEIFLTKKQISLSLLSLKNQINFVLQHLILQNRLLHSSLIIYHKYFNNMNQVLEAYENQKLSMHSDIWVKFSSPIHFLNNKYLISSTCPLEIRINLDGTWQEIRLKKIARFKKTNLQISQYIRTTPGRILFNSAIQTCVK